MRSVVGTITRVEPELPQPGTFAKRLGTMVIKGDDDVDYTFNLERWAKVGQRILIEAIGTDTRLHLLEIVRG